MSQLLLSNPFNDSSSEDEPTAAPPTPTTNALRAQLHHFLPRHTFFRARIHIHQIANIPLVSGAFAVKWKFKHVHTPSGNKQGGILGIVKREGKGKGKGINGKGKGKSKEGDEDQDELEAEPDSNSQGSGDQNTPTTQLPSTEPSQLLSAEWRSPSTVFSSTASSRTAVSCGASTYTSSSRSSSSSAPPPSQISSTAFSASTNGTGTSTPSTLVGSAPGSGTPARGQTPFLPLKDHGVTWSYTLDVLLRMDVERDSLDLLSSPLTLTVLQAGSEQSLSKPKSKSTSSSAAAEGTAAPDGESSRFGVVFLDLAQYAGKGEVGRRYLLRNSKTNATLKLTVSVTHISGPSEFRAPPLPKGEISNGIAEILEENEVYRTRPRGLNLYGPYEDQEALEIDLLGAKAKSQAKGKGKAKESDPTTPTHPHPPHLHGPTHAHTRTLSSPTPTFDPERLPHAYGPRTTETLIEALFNPVPVAERRKESPFTVFVDPGSPPASPPPRGGGRMDGMGLGGWPSTPPGLGGVGVTMLDMTSNGDARLGAPTRPRPTPTRSGSGIGAGLGIMGLGIGMGIGMGVGVGVAGGRGSVDSRRASQDGVGAGAGAGGSGRVSFERRGLGYESGMSMGGGMGVGRRQASQGAASVWSASTDASAGGASTNTTGTTGTNNTNTTEGSAEGESTLGHSHGHGRGVSFDGVDGGSGNEGLAVGLSPRKGGVKGWFRRKMSSNSRPGSRPGTPTPTLGPAAGLAY